MMLFILFLTCFLNPFFLPELNSRYFLLHGYAVIFLHRQRSYEPFCRHFEGHNALDLLEPQLDATGNYHVAGNKSFTV